MAIKKIPLHYHCIKSVRIRSYSGQYFSAFGLNNSEYEHFLHSVPPDPDFATHVFLQVHRQCYSYVHCFTNKYHQFFSKIMTGSLTVNLVLLGKCGLRKISSDQR